MTPVSAAKPTSEKRGERFFHSVMWSWFAVAINIFTATFVSAYIIHRVGHVAFGVWALIFTLVDSFWMMDLGFRSATLKYTAHYRALGQPEKVNETLNTGLCFSGAICVLTMTATVLLARKVARFENISPEYL